MNPSVLKLIFLNLLRIGRNNCQASDGSISILKNSGMLVDWTVGIFRSYSKRSAGISKALLVEDDVMHLKKYPKQHPVWCPNKKKIESVDVPDKDWNTFKKQSEEMNEYDYVFLAWWSSSCLPGLVGVPDIFPC